MDMDAVEEADVEICSSGFDNLLMDPGLEELREYEKLLLAIGAPKCARVIRDLLAWVDSENPMLPIDAVARDVGRYTQMWREYDKASCEEDPRSRAEGHWPTGGESENEEKA